VILAFLVEFIAILFKLHALRKEGIDLQQQEYRSPVYDSIDPALGNSYASFNKWRVRVLFIILGIVFVAALAAQIVGSNH